MRVVVASFSVASASLLAEDFVAMHVDVDAEGKIGESFPPMSSAAYLELQSNCDICPTGTLNATKSSGIPNPYDPQGGTFNCGAFASGMAATLPNKLSVFRMTCGEAQAYWKDICCEDVQLEAIKEDCCGDAVDKMAASEAYKKGGMALIIGNEHGSCCEIEAGVAINARMRVASMSKMATAYTILGLVNDLEFPEFTLETKAVDVFDWWEVHDDDRDQVTVKSLLAQTDGFNTFPHGLGNCPKSTVKECAKFAYDEAWGDHFGKFEYSETSFFIVGAMALQVTSTQHYQDLFKRYVADPLGIQEEQCGFSDDIVLGRQTDPGGSLSCSAEEYAKILRAVFNRTSSPLPLNETLINEAELVQTASAPNMPYAGERMKQIHGRYQHYGLGQWRECETSDCQDGQDFGQLTQSIGFMGSIPWIYRNNGVHDYWAVLLRWERPGPGFDFFATDFRSKKLALDAGGIHPQQKTLDHASGP